MTSKNTPPESIREESLAIVSSRPPGLLSLFRSLRQRNFRLYWFGQSISLIGGGMQGIGQAWLVLELTHSAWQLGLIGALQALPILCFSLFGGIFADRWPKQHILLLSQGAAMLQALLLWLFIVSGTIQLWHLYLLALLLGLTHSIYLPTSRAFLSEMVGRDDLPNAVALNSSVTTLARIVGPGLAGIIIAISGVTTLFLLNALSFLPIILALALMKRDELHIQNTASGNAGPRPSTWQSLREGIAYTWQTPAIVIVVIVVGLVLLFGSNFNLLLPLFATDIMHVGPVGLGALSAALATGSLFSALWLAWSNKRATITALLLMMLLFGLLEVIFAIMPIYLLSLPLIACIGFIEMTFATQSMTILQAVTHDHLRGRVMSVQVLFFDGSLPLGYLLIGWLSSLYGADRAMLIGALLSLLTTGVGWLWWRFLSPTHFG